MYVQDMPAVAVPNPTGVCIALLSVIQFNMCNLRQSGTECRGEGGGAATKAFGNQ
jgi:hypothetical protein